MATRKIKDAYDVDSNELIYYKSHAKATFMSDGRTVEDAIKTAGGGGMAVIDHGTEDTTFTLTSGVIHKWGLVDSLTLGIPEDSEGIVSSYRVVFVADSTFVLSLPSNIVWANDEAPDFSEDGMQYEINIIGHRALWAKFPNVNYGTGFLGYAQNELGDYVLTDYVISSNDYGVECKVTLINDNTSYKVVGGSRTAATIVDAGLSVAFYSSAKFLDWSGERFNLGGYVVNNAEVFDFKGKANTKTSCPPIMLYGLNENGSNQFNTVFKIHYFRILGSGGVPRLDLRPYRNEEGVVGFKDLVSGKFYTSVNNTLTGA